MTYKKAIGILEDCLLSYMQSDTADKYFQRYAWDKRLFDGWLPDYNTGLIIVMPAYNEPDVLTSIRSISKCDKPSCLVTLLVIINESEQADKEIKKTNTEAFETADQFKDIPEWLTLKVSYVKLPHKKAGVGLARKIGMDEAARWYFLLNKRGVIVCFDADSTCSENYLKQLENHYSQEGNHVAITNYEHPLNLGSGIIPYELHLRYYSNALAFAGYPKPFQTLGSCISIDAATYIQAGGMNTRKAGEDFYFLHKVAVIKPISEINTATIFPSDRLSERVPFGTGRALLGYKDSQELLTYSLDVFIELKDYFYLNDSKILSLEEVNNVRLRNFLTQQKFAEAYEKMQANSGKHPARLKQLFFNWWDGLKVLRYIHYCRDHGDRMIAPDVAITILNSHFWKEKIPSDQIGLLLWLREKDCS